MVSQSFLHRLTLRMLGMGLTVGVTLGLAGCAGAPVQEMSNARQAIKAARDATGGSSVKAPASLAEAEALLDRAEDSLQKRAYKQARRDAIAARGKAAEALSSTRTADDRNGAT